MDHRHHEEGLDGHFRHLYTTETPGLDSQTLKLNGQNDRIPV